MDIKERIRVNHVLMIYASMSGNTEAIADVIEESLTEEGIEVVRKEALDADAEELLAYDHVLLGAYTWGEGELPDEFLDFYEDMENLELAGKKVAVFGSGDMVYEHFCAAVDLLEQRIVERGGELVTEGLKVELAPYGEDIERCQQFAKRFMEKALLKSV
jgi:flavodoxin I